MPDAGQVGLKNTNVGQGFAETISEGVILVHEHGTRGRKQRVGHTGMKLRQKWRECYGKASWVVNWLFFRLLG